MDQDKNDKSEHEEGRSEKHAALSAFSTALSIFSNPLNAYKVIFDNLYGNHRKYDNVHIDVDIDSEEACRRRKQKADADKEASKAERLKDENKLRRRLGTTAIVVVVIQLFICDAFVLLYGLYCKSNGWEIPPQVVISWMASTIVEIVGLLLVMAKSLFPVNGKRDES